MALMIDCVGSFSTVVYQTLMINNSFLPNDFWWDKKDALVFKMFGFFLEVQVKTKIGYNVWTIIAWPAYKNNYW